MSHFEFDIHTHTIASGHGSAATITDMVKTARTQHLNMLGISDHGPATLGGGKPAYFRNLTYAPNPDKPEKLFLFSTPCVILKKKGVFICYSLINTLIKFMASLPVMTA
mgnify:CR=1 FL=1